MINFIKSCGLAGLLILLVTVIVTAVMICMAAKAQKGKQPLGLYAMLALIPLLIGMMGTASGYVEVPTIRKEFLIATGHKMDAELMEQYIKVARHPAYLGGGCTAWLLLLCAGIGMTNLAPQRD